MCLPLQGKLVKEVGRFQSTCVVCHSMPCQCYGENRCARLSTAGALLEHQGHSQRLAQVVDLPVHGALGDTQHV